MHRFGSFFLLTIWLGLAFLPTSSARAQQQTPTPPVTAIITPHPGQAVQGNLSITGTTAIQNFQSVEITFSYANNPTDTWFLISLSDKPVSNGSLGQWDTSTITDGTYTLRMVVTLKDGTRQTALVPNLRVRNYTPVETETPTPAIPTPTEVTPTSPSASTPTPSFTPIPSQTPIPPTATHLPPNPAQLSQAEIVTSIGKGAFAVAALFAMGLLYQALRSIGKRG